MTDKRLTVEKNSHSTMYLLKPEAGTNKNTRTENSHSTMYLLKPLSRGIKNPWCFNSHSTMYLLKRNIIIGGLDSGSTFTFHHVSIKTSADNTER